MTVWQLTVLGGFALHSTKTANVALNTRKDRCLLTYLALQNGKPTSRSHLCNLLWADRAEAQARGSLRQSLTVLRDLLGDDILKTDREAVAIDPNLLVVDALVFGTRAKDGDTDAISLYAGDLLQGLEEPSAEFEQWLRPQRQSLQDLAAKLLVKLADGQSSALDAAALNLTRQLLRHDQLREPLHRVQMKLLARSGDRTSALQAYSACKQILKTELGVDPELETDQTYRDILTGTHHPAHQETPERPSLAVMPFANTDNDPQLSGLRESLAEEITAGLGRFRLLFVIDRHSAAEMARQSMDAREIGKRLGVAFVVQGSIVKGAGQLRISATLVRAETREVIWGESFDVADSEALLLPNQIVPGLVNTLHGRVEAALVEASRRKPSLAAYELVLRGIRHLRGYEPDDNLKARDLFLKALELDPDYGLAKGYHAFAEIVSHGYDLGPRDVLERSRQTLVKVVEDDPDDARNHWLLGLACWFLNDNRMWVHHYRKAMEINPNDANIKVTYGIALGVDEKYDEGIAIFAEAMRQNPFHPQWYWAELGNLLGAAGRHAEAIEALNRRRTDLPWYLARLASAYAHSGEVEQAIETIRQLLKTMPDASISNFRQTAFNERDRVNLFAGLRLAGLKD